MRKYFLLGSMPVPARTSLCFVRCIATNVRVSVFRYRYFFVLGDMNLEVIMQQLVCTAVV